MSKEPGLRQDALPQPLVGRVAPQPLMDWEAVVVGRSPKALVSGDAFPTAAAVTGVPASVGGCASKGAISASCFSKRARWRGLRLRFPLFLRGRPWIWI